MAVQIPFPLPSSGFALNSKVRVNLDFLVEQFNQFNTGTATWDQVAIGTANSLTGTLTFYNASNANYLSFQAGATAADTTFTLPTGAPSVTGKYITSTTGGVMSWSVLSEQTSYVGNELLFADGSGVIQELSPGGSEQILVSASPPQWFDLLGTTNQVVVTPNVGNFTLSLPQSIDTGANVQFNQVLVGGGSITDPAIAVVYSGASTNTGLWSSGGTDLSFTVAGVNQGSIDNAGGLAMASSLLAPDIRATTQFRLSTSTSSIVTIQSGATTAYTLTLPVDAGSSGYVLKTDGSGTLSWVSISTAGGATSALDNLSSVAINSTLKPWVNSSLDFGSSTKNWVNIYLSGHLYNGSTTLATNTELSYLTGVTSAIQTQLNAKATSASPTLTGTITLSSLTASTVLYLNGSSALTSSSVTPTELGYVHGVTSAIQTQLNLLAPKASPSFTGTATVTGGVVHPVSISATGNTGTGAGIILDNTTAGGGAALTIRNNGSVSAWFGNDCAINGGSSLDAAIATQTGLGIRFCVNNSATATMQITSGQNVVVGASALATNATDGFLYIPSCAGTPTGTPTTYTGRVALVYNSSGDVLYIYNPSTGWRPH
jgi:hypothetical protein